MIHCVLRNSAEYSRPRLGIAAVEFAVVAPLFLFLLAGVIEFGQAFRIKHAIAAASRVGARCAVQKNSGVALVRHKVKSQVSNTLNISNGDVNVDVKLNGSLASSTATPAEGDVIAVTVSVSYKAVANGFYTKFLSSSTLSSTCVLMRD